ncbi:clathrin adaptor mu subunit [Cristinia sonorae]|uniref:Clathrin adaptor mu subunit n=1 Tax=Cristinia sonorae TaxID=1940300 RepID=A0A8K0UVQ0_9AGAR|nr:clathrin adaptor mu subunit [Cristinia sonorae]
MAIDGLIILDPFGHPIIQSGFRSSPPAYPLLHIDAFNAALEKSARGSIDPVLFVHSLEYDASSVCCHVKHGDLRFLCPVTGDVDPLYVFAFMKTFIDILSEYLGNISSETLKENFDVVYQLLEETLDAGGHPSTTFPNALRDIVLPPSMLHKMLSVAGVAALAAPIAHGQPFSSPIPWRKMGVRYNNNEIYFDIAETLKATVNKNGAASTTAVWGRVDSNCKLSGTPDLLLNLAGVQNLNDCSFHPCVRIQRWTRDKQLSFVPPDGRFTLMEYRYTSGSVQQIVIPLQIKANVKLEESSSMALSSTDFQALRSCSSLGTIDITLVSRLTTRSLDNVVAQLYLGESATGVNMVATNNSSWSFDSKTKTLSWHIKSAPASSSFNLRGTVLSQKYLRPSRAFRVTFDINQHNFSALKVEQLKMTGELYKPFKGVRGRSVGDVEWRW